jgi:hypothetical protein
MSTDQKVSAHIPGNQHPREGTVGKGQAQRAHGEPMDPALIYQAAGELGLLSILATGD